jgi:P-type Ca2+ transporter type 2B
MADINNQPSFNIKLSELKELMQLRSNEMKEKLNECFGGVQGLADKLNTSTLNGIRGDNEDISKRERTFGRNEIPPKPPKTIFRLAFEALQDPTLIMLMACAFISVGLSFYHPASEAKDEEFIQTSTSEANLEWVEGVAIMLAVIVVVFVTSFNDWRKERQFRGLQDRIALDKVASVVRSGQIVQVNVKDLVVGDICCIKYGDLIPADGIVTQASDLRIDESSLTGETDLIKKNETDNLSILSGTHVMEGSGHFMVTAVGLNSQTGIIMTLLGATEVKDENEDKSGCIKKIFTKSKKGKLFFFSLIITKRIFSNHLNFT